MAEPTSFFDKVIDTYYDILDNKRDPRVDNWLFMASPWQTLAICLTYVYLVKVAGPKLMKNRDPYNLRGLLVSYNALQVVFSAWLFYEYGQGGWFHSYSFRCQPVDYSRSEVAMRMLHVCWWYYFSKFTEFFDTFFFVLRKKFDQVSLLHVIHHGCMPMSVWFGVKFTPGGHSTFFGLLNTFVHIIMYFYYMISALGPGYSRWIWWKKYLTTIQMVQFVAISTHAFQLCFIDCDYPKAFVWWIGLHGVLFLFLFSNFYKKSYKKAAQGAWPKQREIAESKANGNGSIVHKNGIKNGKANGSQHVLDSNSNGIKFKSS